MRNAGIARSAIGLTWAVGLSFSCVSQRGTDPADLQYLLYVGVQGSPSGRVEIVDTESDTVYDSILYDFANDVFIYVSADGRYLATHEPGRPPLIWDLRTRLPISRLPHAVASIHFLEGHDLILGQPYDSVEVYSLPDLEMVDVINSDMTEIQSLPGSDEIVGMVPYFPRTGPGPSKLVIFDWSERRVVDSVLGYNSEYAGFFMTNFSVSSDGERIYVVGSHPSYGPAVVAWERTQRRVLFLHQLRSRVGFSRVSIDDRELWVTDPGSPDPRDPRGPGHILIFDSRTGVALDTIPTVGIDPRQPDDPLYVSDIRFHPDGGKVYVSGSGQALPAPYGPILIIDRKSRAIQGLLNDGVFERVSTIELVPRL